MSPDNVHERKWSRRFTIVLFPTSESTSPRTFSVTLAGSIALILGMFFGIAALIIVVLNFTPASLLLPVSSFRAEQKYGMQIQEINGEVKRLVTEMDKLRVYNLRLRKALGEPVGSDSALAARVQQQHAAESLAALENPGQQNSGTLSAAPAVQDAPAASVTGMREVQTQQAASPKPPNVPVSLPFSMPVSGYTTRGFDSRYNHYGVDFVGRDGSAVLAAADGNVIFSGWTYNDGMMVMIAHDLGYMTVYKHNRALLKNAGDQVRRGDMIALMGNTGATSFGPHLHFEVWKDGIVYNPQEYLLTSR